MNPGTYRSTSQCQEIIDDQNYHLAHQKSKKLKPRLVQLETLFGTAVLFIGTISSAFCFWIFSESNTTTPPYLLILTIAIGIQALPWILKCITPCSHLTIVSGLCIIMGCTSFASAVKLMKNNQKKISPEKTAVSTASQKVTILPSPKKQSSDEGIVALHTTNNP